MSDNVVDFPKRESEKSEDKRPSVRWKCSCGSRQFFLFTDSSVECCGCGGKTGLNEVYLANSMYREDGGKQ